MMPVYDCIIEVIIGWEIVYFSPCLYGRRQQQQLLCTEEDVFGVIFILIKCQKVRIHIKGFVFFFFLLLPEDILLLLLERGREKEKH